MPCHAGVSYTRLISDGAIACSRSTAFRKQWWSTACTTPRAPPPSFSSEPQAASRALSGPLDANVNSVEKSLEIASTGNTAERGARADPDGHEERTHAEESSLDEEFGSFVG